MHDTLIHLDQGTAADFGHFACLVAAAAIRTGLPVDLDVPVQDGRVRLPGLGSLLVASEKSWVRLRSDGARVTAGDEFAAEARRMVPDDGTGAGAGVAGWSGTRAIRAGGCGPAWTVLLETGDPYLDRYTLPMRTAMPMGEVADWRERVSSAWQIVADRHRWAAEPMADVISVIVPLTPRSDTDLVSATTPAAYGAIATSWPPDEVTLAETLVHEFQHVKLCGLLDMVPLAASGGQRVYAPWRQDPRPAAGLLQGIYAHLGIVRFWQAQQDAETDPDGLLRAQVLFARWRAGHRRDRADAAGNRLAHRGRDAVRRTAAGAGAAADVGAGPGAGRPDRRGSRPGSPAHLAAPPPGDRCGRCGGPGEAPAR